MTFGWGRAHGEIYRELRKGISQRVERAICERGLKQEDMARDLCFLLKFSKHTSAYGFISAVRSGRAHSLSWTPSKFHPSNQTRFAHSLEHNERELRRISTIFCYLGIVGDEPIVKELKEKYPPFNAYLSQAKMPFDDFQI